MLLQIRDFIRQEKIVSIQQVARRFCMDIQALQPILDIWVSKGVIGHFIESIAKTSCQKSCYKCEKLPNSYYQIL